MKSYVIPLLILLAVAAVFIHPLPGENPKAQISGPDTAEGYVFLDGKGSTGTLTWVSLENIQYFDMGDKILAPGLKDGVYNFVLVAHNLHGVDVATHKITVGNPPPSPNPPGPTPPDRFNLIEQVRKWKEGLKSTATVAENFSVTAKKIRSGDIKNLQKAFDNVAALNKSSLDPKIYQDWKDNFNPQFTRAMTNIKDQIQTVNDVADIFEAVATGLST